MTTSHAIATRASRGGGRCACGEQMIGPGSSSAEVEGRRHALEGECETAYDAIARSNNEARVTFFVLATSLRLPATDLERMAGLLPGEVRPC